MTWHVHWRVLCAAARGPVWRRLVRRAQRRRAVSRVPRGSARRRARRRGALLRAEMPDVLNGPLVAPAAALGLDVARGELYLTFQHALTVAREENAYREVDTRFRALPARTQSRLAWLSNDAFSGVGDPFPHTCMPSALGRVRRGGDAVPRPAKPCRRGRARRAPAPRSTCTETRWLRRKRRTAIMTNTTTTSCGS